MEHLLVCVDWQQNNNNRHNCFTSVSAKYMYATHDTYSITKDCIAPQVQDGQLWLKRKVAYALDAISILSNSFDATTSKFRQWHCS